LNATPNAQQLILFCHFAERKRGLLVNAIAFANSFIPKRKTTVKPLHLVENFCRAALAMA
jgi:hypothetical protein